MSLRQPCTRIALGAAALTLLLTACATGPRPTLVDAPTATDAVAQAVLDRLERATSATFTADYEITPALPGQPPHATVIHWFSSAMGTDAVTKANAMAPSAAAILRAAFSDAESSGGALK